MGESVSQLIKSGPQGLSSIQDLVKEDLDLVATELHRIVVSDFELIDQVNAVSYTHLTLPTKRIV